MPDLSKYFKINPNQNLLGLAIALIALGFSEYFGLEFLLWIAIALTVIMMISVTFTVCAYTINYVRKKKRSESNT